MNSFIYTIAKPPSDISQGLEGTLYLLQPGLQYLSL